ncbi:uncharacterized protein LOC114241198 [Bombyx mandarina]|uniref:Uncharacterized protein LOC114241198 n=1 Tax=Bombyx mandarina TaxID=7092 RepID=A0A6J2JE68_BOMMA|nr:uncharacterized protein LOC114241198 [Bombyx mandarina]
MNRHQRRYGKVPKNESDSRVKVYKELGTKLEVVLAPKSKDFAKPMTNRSCFVAPEQRDFGQFTNCPDYKLNDFYQVDNRGPIIPNTIGKLKELKNVICVSSNKVEQGSQCNPPVNEYLTTSDGSQWQSVENIDELDKYIDNASVEDRLTKIDYEKSQNIEISEAPRVKVIIEKFTKYKKDNIELRKLDERVVCVEYDVFGQSGTGESVALRKMRVFFSIKPSYKDQSGNELPLLNKFTSDLKRNFGVKDDDLHKMNGKEVEIIDDEISENKPYLDDLRKILKRKQNSDKTVKNNQDLLILYEMAKKDLTGENFSKILTKEELQDIKDLILKECTSSAHGISRRKVKSGEETFGEREVKEPCVPSKSIVAELLREDGRTNVFK